ncbi:unnamed protein product [Prorocentrum cordatum]|uniref:Subtilisin n=1 Tax=Prorocentrum cordatum TaxID=2364126 RepID=A0ABN9XJX3_9DINO|nr:unnamed protein product [Polarella glacialis]
MLRVLSLSAAAAVSGLHVSQEPMQLLGSRHGSGVVRAASSAALDPEFTNTLGEKFHVAWPGEFNLIGIPKDADIVSPSAADLVVNATLEDVGLKDCDDLLIRKVTVFGTKIGSFTSLEFSIGSDDFNTTDALGLKIDGVSKTVTEFLADMPTCTFTRPRVVALPTKNSFRKRSAMYSAVCNLGDVPNTVTLTWSSVWRKNYGDVYYQNDLEVFVSGVGSDPAGLLGPDDHSWTQQIHSACTR